MTNLGFILFANDAPNKYNSITKIKTRKNNDNVLYK